MIVRHVLTSGVLVLSKYACMFLSLAPDWLVYVRDERRGTSSVSSNIVASSETALIAVFFKEITKDLGPVAFPLKTKRRRTRGSASSSVLHLLVVEAVCSCWVQVAPCSWWCCG